MDYRDSLDRIDADLDAAVLPTGIKSSAIETTLVADCLELLDSKDVTTRQAALSQLISVMPNSIGIAEKCLNLVLDDTNATIRAFAAITLAKWLESKPVDISDFVNVVSKRFDVGDAEVASLVAKNWCDAVEHRVALHRVELKLKMLDGENEEMAE